MVNLENLTNQRSETDWKVELRIGKLILTTVVRSYATNFLLRGMLAIFRACQFRSFRFKLDHRNSTLNFLNSFKKAVAS